MRISNIFLGAIIFSLSFLVQADEASNGPKTPNHIFQSASILSLEIDALRAAQSKTEKTKEPAVQINKLPFHVYAKAVEVHQKIVRLQKQMNLPVSDDITLPVRKITPPDVYPVVANLESMMNRILVSQNIAIPSVEFITGKTPSNSYEELMRASFKLDSLLGATDPNLVFQSALMIQSDLTLIAQHLQKPIIQQLPEQVPNSQAHDVNIEAYKALYKLAKLERKLQLNAVRVADFPVGKITPGDVYDTTNTLLAELVRVKVQLGLTQPSQTFPLPKNKKAEDVRQIMTLIGSQIDALI